MSNINKIRLSGTTYDIEDLNAAKTVELTQAQYDALAVKDPNTFYVILDAEEISVSGFVQTSAITTSITSSSTDSQVPSAKAVYDQIGGLKFVSLSQAEYDALVTKDASTIYFING